MVIYENNATCIAQSKENILKENRQIYLVKILLYS